MGAERIRVEGGRGIDAIELLQIVLITLKLIGKIDWPWWQVLAPSWGLGVIVLLAVIGFGIYFLYDKWRNP